MELNKNFRQSSNLPLCILLNARSIYNKQNNLTDLLHQLGPDVCLISETFERERKKIETIIKSKHFKTISNYRKNRAPGGGCAIIFNEERFSVKKLEIHVPDEIESCWALLVPKSCNNNQSLITNNK